MAALTPPADLVLALDLGTTAVKCAIVDRGGAAARICGAAQTCETRAYVVPSAGTPPTHREQDVGCILSAIETCTSALDKDLLSRVRSVALCDQMHGVVLWRRRAPGALEEHVLSRLITWEDRRCGDALLASLNDALLENQLAPVFSGFGWATLAHLVTSGDGGDVLSRYDAAGTIGAYVAHMLTLQRPGVSSSPPPVVMDETDAASWGFLDWNGGGGGGGGAKGLERVVRIRTDLLSRVSPRLAMFAPDMVCPPGSPLPQPLCATSAAAAGLGTLAGVADAAGASGASISVFASCGDHAAAVAGACIAMHAADEAARAPSVPLPLPVVRPTVLINFGTSAQAAAIGFDSASVSAFLKTAPSSSSKRVLVEERPLFDVGTLFGVASSIGRSSEGIVSASMLVAASMNGGNVLAHLAGALSASRHDAADSESALRSKLEGAYAELEAGALGLLSDKAVGIYDGCAVLSAVGFSVDAQIVPERVPMHSARLAGEESTTLRDRIEAIPRINYHRGCGKAPAASEPGAPEVYAAACVSVLWNILGSFPPDMWAATERIVLTGAAFKKSASLRAAFAALAPRLGAEKAAIIPLGDDALQCAGLLGAACIAQVGRV